MENCHTLTHRSSHIKALSSAWLRQDEALVFTKHPRVVTRRTKIPSTLQFPKDFVSAPWGHYFVATRHATTKIHKDLKRQGQTGTFIACQYTSVHCQSWQNVTLKTRIAAVHMSCWRTAKEPCESTRWNASSKGLLWLAVRRMRALGTKPCCCPASFTPPQQRTAPWRW